MLYTPLMPEAGAGAIEPRHVVVPLRQMCPHAELVLGRASALHEDRRCVSVESLAGPVEIEYERLVVALGAVTRVFPVPGLHEHGLGFKDLADAIALRNRVLSSERRSSRRRRRSSGSSSSGRATRAWRHSPRCTTSRVRRSATTRRSGTSGSAGCWSTPRRRSCPRSRAGSATTPRATSPSRASRSTSPPRSSPTTVGRPSSRTGRECPRGRWSGPRASKRIRCWASSASRSTSEAARASGRSATARRSRTRRPRGSSIRRPASTRSARRGGSRRISRARRSRTATACSARWRRSGATAGSRRSPASTCKLPRLVRRPDLPPVPAAAHHPEAPRGLGLDGRALLPA